MVVCSVLCREQQQWLELVSHRVSACPSWVCTSSAVMGLFRWVLLSGNVPGELALLCLAGCGWRGALGVWEDSSSPRTWRLPKWREGAVACVMLGSNVICCYICFLQTSASSRKSLDAPSWPGVYRLSMSLMERLLKTLRYNFLTEAMDFVGVHQERILQVCHVLPLMARLASLLQ